MGEWGTAPACHVPPVCGLVSDLGVEEKEAWEQQRLL